MTDIPGPNPRELSREGSSVGELCTPLRKETVVQIPMTSLSSAQDMLDYAPHATLLRIVGISPEVHLIYPDI
jgi:hypothetical protein